ncbi:MAG TPA: neutral zinc metallopeptidase [Kineosporiaceae bacterium]|nr:neutral zinc metallopeptidase [Kineosporiaceae bacterium]
MPIEFDDSRVSVGGVDDRRGGGLGGLGGGGLAIGGGAGVVGLVIYLLFSVLGGGGGSTGGGLGLPVDGSQVGSGSSGESSEQLQQRCNTEGALDKYTDCRLIKVYNVADTVWKQEFDRRGIPYNAPRLVFFTSATRTGCGQASASTGPFYCPADQRIYFDLGFLQQLQDQFGAQGQFAQAYILAHEYGHHLQTLLGTEPKVRAAQERNPSLANRYSVALELQADCYAGVWAKLADQSQENGIGLTADNVKEAQNAAAAVGDDRIQEETQGRVNPESFTHGTAEQRSSWFTKGYSSGNIDSCNTFANA